MRRLLNKVLMAVAIFMPIGASATYSASPQVLEKTSGRMRIFNPEKRGIIISSDDIRNPQKREEMRMERRVSTPLQSKESSLMLVEEPICQVTCVFEGEYYPYFAIYNPGFFEETHMRIWMEMESENTYVFEVPAGTYDVCADFFGEVDGVYGHGILVHEDIEVMNDITVSFSKDEATVVQRIRPVLRNGQAAKLPIGTDLEEEPWIEVDDTEATAKYINYDYTLFREGCEPIVHGYRMADICMSGQDSDFCMISNPLSDKYHTILYSFFRTTDDEYDISTTHISGLSNSIVNTYNQGFEKLPIAEFIETPLFLEEGCEQHRMAVTGCYWIDNRQAGGGGLYMSMTNPNVYVASQDAETIDIKTTVLQTSVQLEKTVIEEVEEDGEIFTYEDQIMGEIFALPVWYNDGQWNYINQNHSECGNYSYQCPVEGPIVDYPGLEPYCFTSKEVIHPFGNSSPILVLMTQLRDWDGSTIISMSPQAWVGRYGEVRNCDNMTAISKVVDGEGNILFDSTIGGHMGNWVFDYFTTPHNPGPLNCEFVDTNILIDGEISGCNRTTMEIDETRDDNCTPTPQMLIFKNTGGEIIDRFNEATDGVIEFSAGDFNWLDDIGRFTVEEADVKVEYAPYGEDVWKPIEVEEVPEYFYMPGFGYFYRGSLGCVDMPSSNGWYDLRMTLTDKAGNRTVEHISPAFKIGTGSGVKNVAVDGIKVWVADEEIRTNADAASIEAYTLDGRKLGEASGTTLGVSDYEGALLVRVTAADGTTTTHKLMVK